MSDEETTRDDEVAAANAWNETIIAEFRANEGRVGGPFSGAPVLLLHTIGARSGATRVNPLVYLPDGEHVYVFASKAGADTNPDWYHNLLRTSRVEVELGSEKYEATAHPISGDDRDRVFEAQKERNPGFADYEAKTTRTIPVVELIRW